MEDLSGIQSVFDDNFFIWTKNGSIMMVWTVHVDDIIVLAKKKMALMATMATMLEFLLQRLQFRKRTESTVHHQDDICVEDYWDILALIVASVSCG